MLTIRLAIVAVTCVAPTSLSEGIEAAMGAKAKRSPIFLWSIHDTIHPLIVLEAPDEVLSFKFMPKDPMMIVGACSNGQVHFNIVSLSLHVFTHQYSWSCGTSVRGRRC